MAGDLPSDFSWPAIVGAIVGGLLLPLVGFVLSRAVKGYDQIRRRNHELGNHLARLEERIAQVEEGVADRVKLRDDQLDKLASAIERIDRAIR